MNRRQFIKKAALAITAIMVTIPNVKRYIRMKYVSIWENGDYSMAGWEFPTKSNNYMYIHHVRTQDSGIVKYYIDGINVSLKDKRVLI